MGTTLTELALITKLISVIMKLRSAQYKRVTASCEVSYIHYIHWVPGALSLGVKLPGREADHLTSI
jgi:hypothetical protein